MSSGQLLIVLGVAAITLLAVAVLRRAGIPAPVVLVVAGLIIGFLPFVPDVSLQPDVVLLGLLPLLVYDAAVTSSPTAFFRNARSIGVLAVPLVVATALVVAAVAHWLGHLSWPMAFVLGTAVGPTDASAATSIARRLGLPRRLVTILEGEALFNDATALVLYAAAVAAATAGYFSVARTTATIVYSAAAGGAIGMAVGLVGRRLRNRIDDPPIEIAGSILLAYAAYLPARPSTRRVCWLRSLPVCTWAGIAAEVRSLPGADSSPRLSGKPWCSWLTPPCSCWWDCRSTPSARRPEVRQGG